MAQAATVEDGRLRLVLVARKGGFGLPTACPSCLAVYVALRLAKVHFDLQFDLKNPDSGIAELLFFSTVVLLSTSYVHSYTFLFSPSRAGVFSWNARI